MRHMFRTRRPEVHPFPYNPTATDIAERYAAVQQRVVDKLAANLDAVFAATHGDVRARITADPGWGSSSPLTRCAALHAGLADAGADGARGGDEPEAADDGAVRLQTVTGPV